MPNDAGNPRVRPDAGQVWAGVVATAVVAALATLAAVVYPFSTGAPLDQKAPTQPIHLPESRTPGHWE